MEDAMSSDTLDTKQNFNENQSKKKKNIRKIYCRETIALIEKVKKLEISNKKYISQLKRALKLGKNVSYTKAVKNFAMIAAIYRFLQLRNAKKHKMGQAKEIKVLTVKSCIKDPIVYKWLQKISALPTPPSVLKPGINEEVFMQLKEESTLMLLRSERLCVLLLDRIPILPHLDYNKKKDTIKGFVDDGTSVQMDIADHALVFMIRGVEMNYKQLIMYTLCNRRVDSNLSALIVDVIKKLHRAGFIVISTVCSDAAANVKAIDHLIELTRSKYKKKGEELNENVFEVNGRKVIPFYDPPHLLKSIRNNLMERKLRYTTDGEEKTASWDHIVMLYGERVTMGGQNYCVAHRLTDEHVLREKIDKNTVYIATQVFSRTVGGYLGFMGHRGILPNECLGTAHLVVFFDKLFDSVNGSYKNFKEREIPLLRSARDGKHSVHKKIWLKAKDVLASMKFINENGEEYPVRAINCWLRTIENFEVLLKTIPRYGLESVWLRRFNLDPLENFFGRIRHYSGRHMSPTCTTFEIAFKRILIKNIRCSNSARSYCEPDSCQSLKAMNKAVFTQKKASSTNVDCNDLFEEFSEIDETTKNEKILTELQYVSGYMFKNIKRYF